jgi:hypothetical protein
MAEGSFWGDALSAGAGIYSANQAAKAAETAAASQRALGDQAVSMAQFKPYSITSGVGSSYFDEKNQRAGYELNPVYQAFRDRYMSGGAGVMDQLGSFDPNQAAQTYLAEQQGLLAPQRMAEDQALRAQQMQRGRIGMGISSEAAGAGVGGMVNPEQFAMMRSRDLANAQMAAQAREQGQADIDRLIGRGTGLFATGAGIDEMGYKPLTIGADIGSRQATSGANAAEGLLAGGMEAAKYNLGAAAARNYGIQQGAQTLFGRR